ncbi:Hypothetical protein GLP15_4018 [Giardia lamblia P15]|uniref:Uncharacterized protein n=1 Tax=Giardia intestinalis (strain P15) TaxID=658858 RepID=E1F8D9_GIAIA|nr:Hypothetical protein GLP15_4018 [Giardia lamblia P15]
MDKKELDALLDALFPELIADDTSTTTIPSRLSYDSKAGLGYAVKQTEGDKKIMETFRRLDGSERKSAPLSSSESHRLLGHSMEARAKVNSSLPSSISKESESSSKLTIKPYTESFLDRILKKVKR